MVGVFFLFAQGRVSLIRGQPAKAIECYKKAAAAQQQYRNLHFISYWEIAIANLALWDIQQSLECWTILKSEGTVRDSNHVHNSQLTSPQWSKAIYAFGMAICTLHLFGDEKKAEISKLFAEVPKLKQRIAGKSIPLEVSLLLRAMVLVLM